MNLIKIFKNRKLFLLNIFLTLYIAINLIGGERGLISYYEKKDLEQKLDKKYYTLNNELQNLENKNLLLSKKISLDYLDILYRQKLKVGTKDEIIIKLNNEK